jgi:hypothetical protein
MHAATIRRSRRPRRRCEPNSGSRDLLGPISRTRVRRGEEDVFVRGFVAASRCACQAPLGKISEDPSGCGRCRTPAPGGFGRLPSLAVGRSRASGRGRSGGERCLPERWAVATSPTPQPRITVRVGRSHVPGRHPPSPCRPAEPKATAPGGAVPSRPSRRGRSGISPVRRRPRCAASAPAGTSPRSGRSG